MLEACEGIKMNYKLNSTQSVWWSDLVGEVTFPESSSCRYAATERAKLEPMVRFDTYSSLLVNSIVVPLVYNTSNMLFRRTGFPAPNMYT